MGKTVTPDERFPILGYVILNALAWAFLAVAFLFTGWVVGEWRGLGGFFLILAVSFTAVSVFDALYDRLGSRPSRSGDDGDQAPES